jgi:hypothetical protein
MVARLELDNQPKKFIVRGRLSQPDGSPLSGIIVRAYNKGLRSEQLLGEAVTDDNGGYEIKHAVASADLILRAFGPEGEELAILPRADRGSFGSDLTGIIYRISWTKKIIMNRRC